ncbi:flagellar motor switch protein FliG [Croceicoccus mobilis]|uniref:Flagellar motor switch protein FliG n=1 Tax=Croceicoccus mobilis TaxID=1703339 RepID=A0A916YWK2_9SPHN|nr:FliG C-terminal domain-containing protein [Croceicoccus mobilis]GGD64321.1 flagellar motor switch protein FliG [Croceicoccus mobilis]
MDDALTPTISPAAEAAMMVMLLDEEQAASLLSQLGPDELQRLGQSMCALGDVAPDAINRAIASFVSHAESAEFAAQDRSVQVRQLMTRAVGDIKADNLMQRIVPEAPPSPLELLRWLTPQSLSILVRGEHPQAIALLLLQIEAEPAAKVVKSLDPAVQGEVMRRVATMGTVQAGALKVLEQMLERRIRECHGHAPLAMGGAAEAAAIINGTGKAVEKVVMPAISKFDKKLARRIEEEMFRFEHLFALPAQQMGALLREVDSDILIDALKGIAETEREFFFAAMSSRAADGLKDEIEGRGRLKMEDVVTAQRAVIAVARRLAAEGTIIIGSGDDEYV